ncbi:winged helix DNA-binding domain-containing protein [Kitasatospora purpeofusca]|uniref:winged helix DNA-binding domain-containing protein n=1 Tax=Kitasatospora purpeofusca TaxID=67352 RepID=UPI002A599532|nr:winged helix DNA-binding domain-containing protein [Kitasatospora purpeofusca]MDY0813892.1 winged helix DNA-binding domain-containing protein [Kitasatospora purpeofusca]
MSAREQAGGAAAEGGVLGRRALGRALLARQHLLERTTATPAAMIGHLGGLQAQAVPQPPYLGLLSRLDGFAPGALTELIESRRAVRIALQRGTIHLVTAEDCLTLRPLLQPVLDKALRTTFGKWLVGLDLDALAAEARALVEEQPRTFQLLGTELAATRPDRDPAALAQAVRALLPLVQVPPRGLWGRSGPAAHTTAEAWLGRPLDPGPSLDDLALRYLAAFGPATAADLQKWCGLSGLAPVLKRLAPRLVTFRDEHGRLLHDLPEAPRPDPDTPAPVRLLAPFDNLLLSHADRTRVLPEEYRPRVMTQNGLVLGTLLLDGLVAGSWRLVEERSGARSLTVRPFGPPLDPSDRRAAVAEAERVLAFAGGDGEVRFEAAG